MRPDGKCGPLKAHSPACRVTSVARHPDPHAKTHTRSQYKMGPRGLTLSMKPSALRRSASWVQLSIVEMVPSTRRPRGGGQTSTGRRPRVAGSAARGGGCAAVPMTEKQRRDYQQMWRAPPHPRRSCWLGDGVTGRNEVKWTNASMDGRDAQTPWRAVSKLEQYVAIGALPVHACGAGRAEGDAQQQQRDEERKGFLSSLCHLIHRFSLVSLRLTARKPENQVCNRRQRMGEELSQAGLDPVQLAPPPRKWGNEKKGKSHW